MISVACGNKERGSSSNNSSSSSNSISTGLLISPSPDQEGNKLMFLSEGREFPSTPSLTEKKT